MHMEVTQYRIYDEDGEEIGVITWNDVKQCCSVHLALANFDLEEWQEISSTVHSAIQAIQMAHQNYP